MDIGFIGLGKMGFPMARRLIEAGHSSPCSTSARRRVDKLVALGAKAATSPKDVADRAETVMASLPSLQASLEVATGTGGVIEGKRVKALHRSLHRRLARWRCEFTACWRRRTSCRSTAPSAAASAAPRRARWR